MIGAGTNPFYKAKSGSFPRPFHVAFVVLGIPHFKMRDFQSPWHLSLTGQTMHSDSMPMNDNPANLRQQAHDIASKAKSARSAWSELKTWASGKGPLAMKSAADEFMATHARSPEAAIIIPEVLQSASFGMSPMERQGLLTGRPSPMLGRPSPTQFNPMASREMFSLSNFFKPKQNEAMPRLGAVIPVDAQRDPVYLKDAQFRMRGSADVTLPKPSLGPARPPQKSFDASKSPDSLHMGAQGGSGGEILHNLVQNMRTHGRDDFTLSHSMPMRDASAMKALLAPAPKTAKPKAAKPKAKKRTVKPKRAKKVVKQARKPAKKAKTKKTTKRPLVRKARPIKSRRPVKRAKKRSRR